MTMTEAVMATMRRMHVIETVTGDELPLKQLDLSWQTEANCIGVDPDTFFPERGASTREAKSICGACSVKASCLEYALDNAEKFGIWGGTSERERRRLRRSRSAETRAREITGGKVAV